MSGSPLSLQNSVPQGLKVISAHTGRGGSAGTLPLLAIGETAQVRRANGFFSATCS